MLPGSVAIDKGFTHGSGDQRGFPRPFDYPSLPNSTNSGNGADIGAYEDVPYIEEFRFSSGNYSVSENEGFATISVERSGQAITSSFVGVGTALGESTATYLNHTCTGNIGDFVFYEPYIIFAVGESSKTFSIPICLDVTIEGDETIVLKLFSPNPISIGDPGTSLITIKDVTARPDNYSIETNNTLIVPAPGVLSNDIHADGGNTLSALNISGPANAASFSLNLDGSFSYTPSADFEGLDSFTYKTNDDGQADSNVATVTISVRNGVNDAPIAVGDSFSTDEDDFFPGRSRISQPFSSRSSRSTMPRSFRSRR